jgi:RNA polymerase sigma-70 factor (ECF subfamily)
LPFSDLDSEDEDSDNFEDSLVDESEFNSFLQQDFELEQIKDAMQQLDTLSREIIFLRYIEDKSYTEIEEQLLLSQDAIRQRISRALKKLKEILNP